MTISLPGFIFSTFLFSWKSTHLKIFILVGTLQHYCVSTTKWYHDFSSGPISTGDIWTGGLHLNEYQLYGWTNKRWDNSSGVLLNGWPSLRAFKIWKIYNPSGVLLNGLPSLWEFLGRILFKLTRFTIYGVYNWTDCYLYGRLLDV